MLLQSGVMVSESRSRQEFPTPVLTSQAPAKALATITASGFGHPKANTLP